MPDTPKHRTKTLSHNLNADGFDVMCSIGRVAFDPNSPRSAHVQAFILIAEHDTPGVYTFPSADGSMVSVDVSYGPRGCGADIGDGLRCGDTDKRLGLLQLCDKCLDRSL